MNKIIKLVIIGLLINMQIVEAWWPMKKKESSLEILFKDAKKFLENHSLASGLTLGVITLVGFGMSRYLKNINQKIESLEEELEKNSEERKELRKENQELIEEDNDTLIGGITNSILNHTIGNLFFPYEIDDNL